MFYLSYAKSIIDEFCDAKLLRDGNAIIKTEKMKKGGQHKEALKLDLCFSMF